MAFPEVIKIINTINESILEGMTAEHNESNEEFLNHLRTTKSWYSRISCVNKKLYVLALLEDVRSAWTLSLLLKSIWNCRPKDSVFSSSGSVILSGYDQSPLDNNRTALPVAILTQVMNNDRQWFISLEAEEQAIVLVELLSIAGGPVAWQVLKRAQKIYERYRESEIDNLKESVVVSATPVEQHHHPSPLPPEQTKKDTVRNKIGDSSAFKQNLALSQAQKRLQMSVSEREKMLRSLHFIIKKRHCVVFYSCVQAELLELCWTTIKNKFLIIREQTNSRNLDESVAVWDSSIKLIRDSFKLDEVETTFRDGTKKKIWKVDRPMAEVTETVDFLQLLPSSIGKRILAYLPFAQLNEYARVNKYWAYLIDEFRAEVLARQKTNVELDKLRASKPIRNMADFYERLDRRGAADENISKWCKNLIMQSKKSNQDEYMQALQNSPSLKFNYFPRFLTKETVKVPLSKPLVDDPTVIGFSNKSATFKIQLPKYGSAHYMDESAQNDKRFSLWSRDFSSLYPVSKIASYQSPF